MRTYDHIPCGHAARRVAEMRHGSVLFRCGRWRCRFVARRILKFIADNDVARRRLYPKPNAATCDLHDSHGDVAVDDEAFSNLSTDYKHGAKQVRETNQSESPL